MKRGEIGVLITILIQSNEANNTLEEGEITVKIPKYGKSVVQLEFDSPTYNRSFTHPLIELWASFDFRDSKIRIDVPDPQGTFSSSSLSFPLLYSVVFDLLSVRFLFSIHLLKKLFNYFGDYLFYSYYLFFYFFRLIIIFIIN